MAAMFTRRHVAAQDLTPGDRLADFVDPRGYVVVANVRVDADGRVDLDTDARGEWSAVTRRYHHRDVLVVVEQPEPVNAAVWAVWRRLQAAGWQMEKHRDKHGGRTIYVPGPPFGPGPDRRDITIYRAPATDRCPAHLELSMRVTETVPGDRGAAGFSLPLDTPDLLDRVLRIAVEVGVLTVAEAGFHPDGEVPCWDCKGRGDHYPHEDEADECRTCWGNGTTPLADATARKVRRLA